VGLFAAACSRAVKDAMTFEDRTQEMQANWRKRLGRVRSGSTTDLLIRALPGAPIITASSAASLTGRSFQAANEAITRLADSKVLHQVSIGRRNRAFEAKDVIDAFAALERRLASGSGDTRSSPPTRKVPRRR
jgi:Fic family protein